ncbi:LysR family transcriptional regulator [Thalassomonas sp. M1454]|uniref:LysR family transcriptional regulator n=1 Tax=Thalassomonas sp. M1454 TaxID=2594477 RepID=UPI0011814DD5|nr:LysR family transcriptional regulator [Thalassomonas sp. M1454]TRX53430.1 LysR family transcriptional regulator [Thalassomonas sp. M1454]
MNKTNIANVDFNLLKTFQVLFEERHVGRSAKRMNVSQSAMSHSLSRLRDTFNERLFERNASGIYPTHKAEELAKEIDCIIEKINKLFDEDTLDLDNLDATITIMTHDFIAMNLLTDILKKIKLAAPKVKLSIIGYEPSWPDLMDNGQIDLVIGSGLNTNRCFESHLFYEDSLVCLLDKEHPALQNWTIAEIYQHEHIKLSLLDAKVDPIDVYARNNDFSRKIGMYTKSLELQASLVVNTNLIAFLPKTLAQHAVNKSSLTMKECPFPLPKLPIKCIWHQKHNNNLKHSWLRSFFRAMP